MVTRYRTDSLSRRTFLASSAGTGLVMGFGTLLSGCSPEQATTEIAQGGSSPVFSPAVWFEIDADGAVQVNIAKAEMGQDRKSVV